MAAVIDLTEISSDEEDVPARVSDVVASGISKKLTSEKPVGAGVVARSDGFHGGNAPSDRPGSGSEKLQPYPQCVLNGGAKGTSPRLRRAKMSSDGDTTLEEANSTWGEPLPPEPGFHSMSDQSPREKEVSGTNERDQNLNSAGLKDIVKKEHGTSFGRPKSSTPAAVVPDDSTLCRHFWRAGDYEAQSAGIQTFQGGMEHVRVHPKFLHSNATSHKWALGAVAELLDNAVDEVQNGATFVSIDKIINPRDSSPALLVQDDGGGMTPVTMRQCMSLGYSRKNTNSTIGQYGNGFKTSTMRLGADVIVFSRCSEGSSVTQSIGLLSYTFLRKTGHLDVVVPMIDYEVSPNQDGKPPKKILRSNAEDWHSNLESIMQWSPYSSESELLAQFEDLGWHGTKVIVYNLWFNDDGVPELDFHTDEQDIQLRGGLKQDKGKPVQQQLAQQHIANRYHHSLRIYASILYLQMPPGFQIILRGKPVEHHLIASDLKFPEQIIYKPQIGNSKDSYKEASVITVIGFTKEAPLINVQGFNVYHKNRLIMPFWKVWQDNSSRGRGVVGVLEANFVEPAHDKQDFERTAVLLRLETRLKQMTLEYWNLHCHLIGYQPNTKAGKARKQAAAPLDYPSPIASVLPNSLLPPSMPPHAPGSSAARTDASRFSLHSRTSADQATESSNPEGVAPVKSRVPSASAPSTPPQPAADGLKSANGDRAAGPQVKPEPIEVDFSKGLNSVNNVSETLQRFKRQRMTSSALVNPVPTREAGGAKDALLLQCDNDAMMIELIQENSQLRSRCVDYEHDIKNLELKVSTLEKELMVVNMENSKLQWEFKQKEKLQNSDQQLSNLTELTEHDAGAMRGNFCPAEEAMLAETAPVIETLTFAPVSVSVKVEQ